MTAIFILYKPDKNETSIGIAKLAYLDKWSAATAIFEMDGQEWMGAKLKCGWCIEKPKVGKFKKILNKQLFLAGWAESEARRKISWKWENYSRNKENAHPERRGKRQNWDTREWKQTRSQTVSFRIDKKNKKFFGI